MEAAFAAWIRRHQLVAFFGLSYLIMFGVMFTFIGFNPAAPLPRWSLPWFLAIFSPSISAVAVAGVAGGRPAISRLVAGFTRRKVGFRWYLAAAVLLLAPLLITLVYRASGHPGTGLKPGETVITLVGTAVFHLFSGPLAGELGWRGFALPRLQAKYNALVSSLVIGVVWTCWHSPLFFVTGASQTSIPFPVYLVLVSTIAVYLTWLFNNTRGSLIVTVLAHFCCNLTGMLTGPLGLMPATQFYLIAGGLLGLATIAAVLVFGPRYLSRRPAADLPFPNHGSLPVG